MKALATALMTLGVRPALGSGGVGGAATSLDVASASVKARGAGVYRGGVRASLMGVAAPGGYTQAAPVEVTIPAGSQKVMVEGEPANLHGDEAVVNVPLVHPDAPSITVAMVVSINEPQTKVRGN